jgi:hypothetical protein
MSRMGKKNEKSAVKDAKQNVEEELSKSPGYMSATCHTLTEICSGLLYVVAAKNLLFLHYPECYIELWSFPMSVYPVILVLYCEVKSLALEHRMLGLIMPHAL